VTATDPWDDFDVGFGGDFGWLSDGNIGGEVSLIDLSDIGPQTRTPPDKRTELQRNCDDKLSSIFGGVAAGSGYEPTGLPGVGGSYRGGSNGHLNNAAHIYGSENGFGEADLYIPAGGTYIGKNPYSNEDSYMFYYSQLGNARNVTLFTSHVANFNAPKGETTGRTNIGDIGGRGGRTMSTVGVQNPSGRGTNIHAHLAIHQNTKEKPRGYTGKRLSFYDVFCK
jgi:hypothetical protein